ncbi:hypothetical protein [Kitasatospora sp. NPDC050463]|uniref:hypothetical protein n=1 Tax=Kitasatospora sp. NPDC050463 TaxID=3155786 RepID=UPI0033C35D79
MQYSKPMFGDRVVSWGSIWDELHLDPDDYDYGMPPPDGDYEAAEMHRLRGLVMAQAAETEAVLGMILKHVDPAAKLARPAGALLHDVRNGLGSQVGHVATLDLIKRAIERRNRVVHDTVHIEYSWRDYATGGGEWVSVISFLGDEEYSEANLLGDLALQQETLVAAVHLLTSLRGQPGQRVQAAEN